MSRSGYSEDCENLGLWRGAVERAIKGKRGQEFLKELAAAMDNMPEKILITDELINADGQCCTLGVIFKKRGINPNDFSYYDSDLVGKAIGIAMAMAAEIAYMNDEYEVYQTPASRWTAMRDWVGNQIVKAPL